MHRHRPNDLRFCLPAPIPGQPHRGEVGLSAAGGDKPDRGRTAEQRRHHSHGLALDREGSRLLVRRPLDEVGATHELVELVRYWLRNAGV